MLNMKDQTDSVKQKIPFPSFYKREFPEKYRSNGNSHAPFREDKKPSFQLNDTFGYDHTTGESWDVYSIRQKTHGLDFETAKQSLIDEYEIVGPGDPETNKKKKDDQTATGKKWNPWKDGKIVATYDYVDPEGNLIYQNVRFVPKNPADFPLIKKDFRPRRPDPDNPGEWIRDLDDTPRVPFGLLELLASLPTDTVYDVEGEKDCLAMRELGFVAVSCGSATSGPKLLREYDGAKYFEGRDVVIIQDNDKDERETGAVGARKKAKELVVVAKSVKILKFPDDDVKDAYDFIKKHGEAAKGLIIELVNSIATYEPTAEDKKEKPKRGRPGTKDKDPKKYLLERVLEFKRGIADVEDDAIPGLIAVFLKSANAKLTNRLDEPELAALIKQAVLAQPRTKKSQVQMAVELLLDEYWLKGWRTVEDEPWVTVWMKNHYGFLHVNKSSKKLKAFVRNAFRNKFGAILKNSACDELIDEIYSICQTSDDVHELHVRFYYKKGRVLIDCCDDGWNQIEITSEGWQVKPQTEPLFKRVPETQPLPIPVYESGAIEDFLDFLTVTNKKHRLLIKCFLVVACIGAIPRPLYLFNGAPGVAKSGRASAIRDCIDPNALDRMWLDWNDQRTVTLALAHCGIVTLENQGSLKTNDINFLCGVATGITKPQRALFENDALTLFKIKKPVIMTGIAPSSIQPDFLDRCVIINMDRMPPNTSRTEESMEDPLEKLKPKVLGWVCETLKETIRIKESGLTLIDPPRMHDFALWGEAAARAMGYGENVFLATYKENIRNISQSLALDTPLVFMIKQLLDEQAMDVHSLDGPRCGWSGRGTPLLQELRRIQERTGYEKNDLPKTANVLSQHLKQLIPALRSHGIIVEYNESTSAGTIWTIKRISDDGTILGQLEGADEIVEPENHKVVPLRPQRQFVCPVSKCRHYHPHEKICLVVTEPVGELKSCPAMEGQSRDKTEKGA